MTLLRNDTLLINEEPQGHLTSYYFEE
jgi:hypothetical protein